MYLRLFIMASESITNARQSVHAGDHLASVSYHGYHGQYGARLLFNLQNFIDVVILAKNIHITFVRSS